MPDGVILASFNGIEEWVGLTYKPNEWVSLGRVADTSREQAVTRYKKFDYMRVMHR